MVDSKYILALLLVTVALGIAYFFLSPSNIFTGSILDTNPQLNLTINPSNIPMNENSTVLFIVTQSGNPISGAIVRVDGAGIHLSGKTNIAGQLKLNLMPTMSSKIYVVAEKEGYRDRVFIMLPKIGSGSI